MVKPRGRPRKKTTDPIKNRLRAQWRKASRNYYYRKVSKSKRSK